MMEWWYNLPPVAQWLYVAAAFFSVFFLWQLIAAIMGLGHDAEADAADGHVDVHVEADAADAHAGDVDAGAHGAAYDHVEHLSGEEAAASIAAFKLLSIRSILAFFTLFCWAGALYLTVGVGVGLALVYGICWGLSGMFAVALIFFGMRRLTETGTAHLGTCVGTAGAVYLNIPSGGQGEVRVAVGGVISHVKARSAGGAEIKAGTPIRVVRLLDGTTIEVAPMVERPAGEEADR